MCVKERERERVAAILRNMETRGNYGIFINGKLYVMFNHMDSYSEAPGLGRALAVELKWANESRDVEEGDRKHEILQ